MSIYKAKTTDEAISIGLTELNLTAETAVIEIISQGGFLKKAEVNICAKCDNDVTKSAADACANIKMDQPCTCVNTEAYEHAPASSESDIVKNTKPACCSKHSKTEGKPRFALHENDMPVINFLKKLFEEMEFDCTLDTRSTKDILAITIKGEDASFIIGHRGESLDNLQYLCLLVANKKTRFKKKLIIDAEGYREIRSEALNSLALKLAQKCINTNRAVELEPMNPFERRLIHTALQENENVTTTSAGADPCRYVVIHPVKTEKHSNAVVETPVIAKTSSCDVEVTPIVTEKKQIIGRTDIDIYDTSVSRSFKTGAYKPQSFGNKRR